MEDSVRQGVGDLLKKGLYSGFAAAECEEADEVSIESDLGADETMRPKWIDKEGAAEHGYRSLVIATSDEDDRA